MRDLFDIFNIQQSDPDPVRRAQLQMHRPLPKRFYTAVQVEPVEAGFEVRLDGKTVRTPARKALAVPKERLAHLIAAEWEAQVEVIDPHSMPVTRLVNTALDAVSDQVEAVLEDIARFSQSDMLCYRAEEPEGLVERQVHGWDPVLEWVAETHGARFLLAGGIIHQEQPAQSLQAFREALQAYAEPIRLSALHTITTLTGSAILALAAAEGRLSLDEAWALAHLDEDWTNEHWGTDEEAEARRGKRFVDMQAAMAVIQAVQT
ncbi:ATP12 family protein [Rhizobium sp. RU36D]|uniref:ATP12 family chaperone protein n=1 Tax=Rhizobium sp. RU36D TaxID=1907415 RepID=UPI0009D7EC98|nr:ATP12 family protein [Rhizobium sp. RU36D]SMC82037.1 Chaperone required for the assembly of the F1-ATPase [Rhizobium sp. RU36D]